jgi:hypothetical protein
MPEAFYRFKARTKNIDKKGREEGGVETGRAFTSAR